MAMKCLVTVVIQGKMEEPSRKVFSFFHGTESVSWHIGPPKAGGEGPRGTECVGTCECLRGKERERTFYKFTGNQLQPRSQMFTNPRILFSRKASLIIAQLSKGK